METYRLVPHASAPPLLAKGITVEKTTLGSGRHQLIYTVENADQLVLPRLANAGRADNLWRETCFELFLRRDDGPAYYEYNFSPSQQWAAYAFAGYRDGMSPHPIDVAPLIRGEFDGHRYVFCVELSGIPQGMTAAGICAVLCEEGQVTSYWALNHPGTRPDFHHAAGFVAPVSLEQS